MYSYGLVCDWADCCVGPRDWDTAPVRALATRRDLRLPVIAEGLQPGRQKLALEDPMEQKSCLRCEQAGLGLGLGHRMTCGSMCVCRCRQVGRDLRDVPPFIAPEMHFRDPSTYGPHRPRGSGF